MTKKAIPLITGGAVAAMLAAPVITVPGAIPHPVSASIAYTALTSKSVEEPSDAAPGTDTREVTPEDDFTAVGLVWDDATEAGDVEVRIKEADGTWGQWVRMGLMDSGPTPGSEEAKNARAGTEPLHVEKGRSVQVRVPEREAEVLDDASVVTVDPGKSAADGTIEPAALNGADAASARPRILTRAQWGAKESYRNCNASYGSTVKAVTLHHTAGSNNYSKSTAAARVRADYAYHTNALGWCDLGYNAMVDKYGTIYEGRAGGLTRPVMGAHAAGFNRDTWGIAMLGNNADVKPSNAQMESIAKLMAWKLSSYNRNPKGTASLTSQGFGGTNVRYPRGTVIKRPSIFAHRDVGSTSCPGSAGYSMLPSLRNRVAELAGVKGGSTDIMGEWKRQGGENGVFGKVVTAEKVVDGGSYARFEKGGIYEGNNGLTTTAGQIHNRYFALKGPEGALGLPATNEYAIKGTTGGRAQNFSKADGGGIYYSSKTAAYAVYGAIYKEWDRLGGATGSFGFPISEETDIPNYVGAGRVQSFEGGDVYWGPRIGAKFVPAAQRDAHKATGGPSVFGMPMSNPKPVAGGTAQRYELGNGYIYGSKDTGYQMVYGAVRSQYDRFGGPAGKLGWPTSEEYTVAGGRAQKFEDGIIIWNSRTGKTIVRGS